MNELTRALPLVRRRATRSLIDAWSWGVELRFWVATCVAGLALFTTKTLHLPLQGPHSTETRLAILITFFSTLALYNLDGTLDEPPTLNPQPSTHNATPNPHPPTPHSNPHLLLTALSTLALLVLTIQLSFSAALFVLLGASLCGIYAVPLSRRGRSTAIKSLPYLKGPFVGSAVAIAVVWVPQWAQTNHASSSDAWLLTAILALYCTANAILFDIPDIQEDTRAAVPTVPARSGVRSARLICATLTCVALLLALTTTAPVPLLALGAALLLATWRITATTTKRTVAWWVDGALLLPLICL